MKDDLLLLYGAASLELFVEILRLRGGGKDEAADILESTVHPNDVEKLAVELRRLSNRVATIGEANEAAPHAAPPPRHDRRHGRPAVVRPG